MQRVNAFTGSMFHTKRYFYLQESRKTKGVTGTPMPNGKAVCEEEEEESHGDDPALQRTGRLVVHM